MGGTLVRDFVPGLLAQGDGDEDTPRYHFSVAPEKDRELLLIRLLKSEVCEIAEYLESVGVDQLAEVMEIIGTIMSLKGWKNEDVALARERLRKNRGAFTRFFVMHPVV
jgi:predicted house-cleaning noncanonical NTP pyrophosphatase (MazG superfamily)